MSEPSRLRPGATIGGKYRLEAPLARGGMGAVWRAQHVELSVPVAIKFMDGTFATSATAQGRFAREAKAAAGLRHPNIVDVRDYGVDGDLPYLVMELLTGEDLGERLKRERRLSPAQTGVILGQMARALRRAHDAGFVHRDLKPGNVFLARTEDEEVVKLLDFGIAKDTAATAIIGDSTRTGELMGSPHYMSPEQIRGAKDLDARSDLWALGVIAFRCLTGRLPFHGDVMGLVIAQILADPIPTATSVAPDLPPEVDAFFARALVRDRTARFANAREMAAAFAPIAGAPSSVEVSHAGVPLSSLIDSGRVSRPITGPGAPITGNDGRSSHTPGPGAPITGPVAPITGPVAPLTGSGPVSISAHTPPPVTFSNRAVPSSPPEPPASAAPPDPPSPSGPVVAPAPTATPLPAPAPPLSAPTEAASHPIVAESVYPARRSGGNRAALVAVGVAMVVAGLCVAFFASGPGSPAPSTLAAGASATAPPAVEPVPVTRVETPRSPVTAAVEPALSATSPPATASAEPAHSADPAHRAHPPAEAGKAPGGRKQALPPISF